jgi:microcystin-dependent protein
MHNIFVPGMIMPYGGTTAPAGWLLCNGTSYSTTTYSALFAVIGYTYGGSGNTFAVPNMSNSTLAVSTAVNYIIRK